MSLDYIVPGVISIDIFIPWSRGKQLVNQHVLAGLFILLSLLFCLSLSPVDAVETIKIVF